MSISNSSESFKDSLCLEKWTYFDAKGAKRSVKTWATNFFFQKYFVLYERWAVKNSIITYNYILRWVFLMAL